MKLLLKIHPTIRGLALLLPATNHRPSKKESKAGQKPMEKGLAGQIEDPLLRVWLQKVI